MSTPAAPMDVPTTVETWPIIEHEPEHEPVVPPDLVAPTPTEKQA